MTNTDDQSLRIRIVRWEDDHFPGFVECRFTDRFAHEHVIVEKVPVVTTLSVTAKSRFPIPVLLRCTVLSRGQNDEGRDTAKISLAKPWGIESTEGRTVFEVFADQLTHDGD